MGAPKRFSLKGAAFWAATWGVGMAIGVALGGWLTAVGGTAAPGFESIEFDVDLVLLPVSSGFVVFVLHFIGQLGFHVVRARLGGAPAGEMAQDDKDHE